jgi:protocatechuate 3,4-dioxygenase beta subunit
VSSRRAVGRVALGHRIKHVELEHDLVKLLLEQRVSCRVWPEQTVGPYRRDLERERRNITEGRAGLPVRVGLRLLDGATGNPLAGIAVHVWQADPEGRYSGFRPFHARPGQVVTSASVPREVVAPSETFLRGTQHTEERGMCAFDTLYPGWYSSRTVHIHVTTDLGSRQAVTHLYFPDDLTDQVFARPPYAGRPPRDTATPPTASTSPGASGRCSTSPATRPPG